VLRGSVKLAIFSSILKEFLSMVFFMVLLPTPTIKPLKVKDKNGLFIIEWE
jgi:hypothetical protein